MKISLRYGLALLMTTCVSAQVFNTGEVLPPGRLTLGVYPLLISHPGNDNFVWFFQGGLGLSPGVDFAAKAGLDYGDNTNYYGADLEWALSRRAPHLSLATGFHVLEDPGLDGTLNLSFPISRGSFLYGGVDADLNFYNGNTDTPMWGFFGLDLRYARRFYFMLEASLAITDEDANTYGAGMTVYLF